MLFRDVSKLDGFSDDDINGHFKLTPDELATIDKYPPPKKREAKTEKVKNKNSRPPRNMTRKPCLPPKEIHPKTGKCVEACKAPKTRNLLTGRCINPPRATGKKGKAAAKTRRVTRKLRRT